MSDSEIIIPLASGKHNPAVNEITVRQIVRVQPKVLYDIGCGDGFWGIVAKSNLPYDTTIIGMDINEMWVNHCRSYGAFTEVIHGDIEREIFKISGDLIIFGDVLEHLYESAAISVLAQANERFHHIIVNGPIGYQPQNHECSYERHRCGISRGIFNSYNVLEYTEYCDGIMMNCLIKGTRKDE